MSLRRFSMARNMKAVAERVEQDAVREVKAEGRVYHTPEVYDLGTLAAVQAGWYLPYCDWCGYWYSDPPVIW
jgi:hypothetical protein